MEAAVQAIVSPLRFHGTAVDNARLLKHSPPPLSAEAPFWIAYPLLRHTTLDRPVDSLPFVKKGAMNPARYSLAVALIFFATVSLLSLVYGLQYRFSDGLFAYFAVMSVPFLLLIGLLSALAMISIRFRPMKIDSTLLAFALTALSWTCTAFVYSKQMAPVPLPVLVLVPVIAGFLGERLWRRGSGAWPIVIGALGFQIYSVAITPLDASAANMLPLVIAGGRDFFAGSNPYLQQYPGIADILHFHYLPGLWLPYAMVDHFGVEPRLVSFAALLGCIGLLGWAAYRNNQRTALACLLWPLVVSPMTMQMVVSGHIWPYWLTLCGFIFVLLERRLIMAAVMLGLMLSTRQLAIFIAVPVAVFFVRAAGFKRTCYLGIVTIVVYFLIIGPFLWSTPDFLHLAYLGLPGKEQAHIAAGNPLDQIGASGLLYHMGLHRYRGFLQATILLAAVVYLMRKTKFDEYSLLAFTGSLYLWLVSLNPFLYRYHYVPGLLLLIAGLALFGATKPAAPGTIREIR